MGAGDGVRIGIIGAENDHAGIIAKTLNVDAAVPGFSVTHLWGETAEFAAKAATIGHIPVIVAQPEDMLGKIDAVVVDHRHGAAHLPAARPFLEAGLPLFIDKPFARDPREARAFLAEARARKVPICSHSAVPFFDSAVTFAAALPALGRLRSVVAAGPADFESPWGGIFFYGIHQAELLVRLLPGDRPVTVSCLRRGDSGVVTVTFESGVLGVLQLLAGHAPGFSVAAWGEAGVRAAPLPYGEKPFLTSIRRFCRMFETREEPEPGEAFCRPLDILDAACRALEAGAPVAVTP